MLPLLPERTRVYQNHHLHSTRWNYFEHRPGDIVISTSYKAGTTWMQSIIGHLLHPRGDMPAPAQELSPWLDQRIFPLELVLNGLAAQRGRRFIKTHLALDGLPYRPEVQYVVVGRDARLVRMGVRRLSVLVAPASLCQLVGVSRVAQHPLRPLCRSAR
jgi:aryl sulfotransferase